MSQSIQDQLGLENHCFGCGPANAGGLQLKTYLVGGDETRSDFTPWPAHAAGPRHILNGGILATIVDCHGVCSAIAAVFRSEGRPLGTDPLVWCVTAGLELEYLKPTPLAPVRLVGRVESLEGRRVVIAVDVLADDVVTVRGRVRAVRVKDAWRAAPAG